MGTLDTQLEIIGEKPGGTHTYLHMHRRNHYICIQIILTNPSTIVNTIIITTIIIIINRSLNNRSIGALCHLLQLPLIASQDSHPARLHASTGD